MPESQPNPDGVVTPSTTPAATDAPPWGDASQFDAERAWKLIQNKDGDLLKLKARLAEFDKAAQERADAEKSEVERAVERAERAERSLAEREAAEQRKDVLSKHGLSAEDAAFLADVPTDQLDERAKALADRLGLAKKDAPAEEIPAKPAPRLTPGHQVEASAKGSDPKSIADRIYSGR